MTCLDRSWGRRSRLVDVWTCNFSQANLWKYEIHAIKSGPNDLSWSFSFLWDIGHHRSFSFCVAFLAFLRISSRDLEINHPFGLRETDFWSSRSPKQRPSVQRWKRLKMNFTRWSRSRFHQSHGGQPGIGGRIGWAGQSLAAFWGGLVEDYDSSVLSMLPCWWGYFYIVILPYLIISYLTSWKC